MCYKENDVALREKIEKDILEFADEYNLLKWEIPALIKGDILKKCGYFRMMPNQITLACSIKEHSC